MEYIAHINEVEKTVQSVKSHSENTAALSREYSVPAFKEIAFAAGLLHDIGKWEPEFQRRIRGENIRVEHSIDGAIEAELLYQYPVGKLLAYCIAGHHSGLPDGGNKNDVDKVSTLSGRLRRKQPDVYSAYKDELNIPEINTSSFITILAAGCNNKKENCIDKFAFFTRYCFSCLVDADSVDTGTFCGTRSMYVPRADFKRCLARVDNHLSSFVCQTDLQRARRNVQEQAFRKIKEPAEIYLLNMPTGSGKTLCSVKFALEKAISEHKERIIYIIPFNSIIDQTVDEFESIFGDDAEILRHQSSFSYEGEEGKEAYSEDYRDAMKNAEENWDAPFIVTTVVQFFESIFSHKRKKLRKLHNMANSILVFDEVHLMPQKYLQPCLQAVSYITKYLNSEALFLTATMPDFKGLIHKYALPDSSILNLIDDTSDFVKFEKCSYMNIGSIEDDELLCRANKYPTSLIVVNSKAKAKELYQNCSGNKYHLSTYMAACDRKRVIRDIKTAVRALEKEFPYPQEIPDNRRITVISTSLIEAGVDLDMHSVFREMAGLDNILQAGGRCNREGKRENAVTCIFSFNENAARAVADEKIELTKGLIQKYADISVKECIDEYYKRLFHMKAEFLERNTISKECSSFDNIPFRTYGEKFKIIDAPAVSIAVARDKKSRELIRQLEFTGQCNVRELQKYTCSVKPWELDDLIKQHVVEDYESGIWCLTNMDYYDEETGIKFEGEDYFI